MLMDLKEINNMIYKRSLIVILFLCCFSFSIESGKNDSVSLSWLEYAHDFEEPVELTHNYLSGLADRDTNLVTEYNFIAIAFLIPKQLGGSDSVANIIYTIKSPLKLNNVSKEFIVKDPYRGIGNSFFKPLYVFGNYTNEKLEILKMYSVVDYVFTPKGLYSFTEKIWDEIFFYSRSLKKNFILARYFHLFYSNQEYVDLLKNIVDFFSKEKKHKNIEKIYNKTSLSQDVVKINPLNAEFIVLGVIRGMKEKKRNGLSYCDIRIVPYFIFRHGFDFLVNKKELNIGVGSEFWNDWENSGLPISEQRARKMGHCFSAKEAFQLKYIFGSFDESMKPDFVVDSLASPVDFFYNDGDLVDLRMGLPYDTLLSYFMPDNFTVDDFYLWSIGSYSRDNLDALTPAQQKEVETATKKVDKFYQKIKTEKKNKQ